MNLPKFSVRNPITTIMMMLLVVILGVVSVSNLKLDLMPNINPPVLAVITNYPGAGPEEVKEMVTKPVEETVSTTPGLKSLQSSNRKLHYWKHGRIEFDDHRLSDVIVKVQLIELRGNILSGFGYIHSPVIL